MIWLDMIPFANLSNDLSRAIYRFNKILSYIADKTEIIDRLHPMYARTHAQIHAKHSDM